MSEFMLRVCLDEPEFCNNCPSLEMMSCDDPMCKSGEFFMKHEDVGTEKPDWIVRRPKGCPLIPMEKLCELVEKLK